MNTYLVYVQETSLAIYRIEANSRPDAYEYQDTGDYEPISWNCYDSVIMNIIKEEP